MNCCSCTVTKTVWSASEDVGEGRGGRGGEGRGEGKEEGRGEGKGEGRGRRIKSVKCSPLFHPLFFIYQRRY